MNKKIWALLLVVILLGSFLRVWRLNEVPMSLFGDEIDVGLQANSILHTGKDYTGISWPVMFHSFTEYRLPGLLYSDVPFIALFGLNEWGVRLATAVWGIFALIGCFLLAKEFFNAQIALIATFFLMISPWHLQFSREANDTGVIFTMMIFAVWAFLVGTRHFKMLLLSTIFFSLTIYSYSIAVLFTPLIILSLFLVYRRKILDYGIKKLMLIVAVGLIVLLPYVSFYFSGIVTQRFSQISITADKDLRDEMVRRRQEANLPLTKMFRSEAVTNASTFIQNYLKAFSSEFLFIGGDPNLRHSTGAYGEMHFFEIMTLILGIVYIVKFKPRDSVTKVVFLWLVIAPISASLTIGGGNHAPRLILMLFPLILVSALGVNWVVTNLKYRTASLLMVVIIVAALVNLTYYFYRYYVEWPIESWRFWQTGYKEVMLYIKANDQKFSKIYFNNTYEPSMPRFLFWYDFNPVAFHEIFKGDKTITDIADGFDGFKVGDKYYFGSIRDLNKTKGLVQLLQKDQIYMVSARDETDGVDWRTKPPQYFDVLKTVTNPYNQPIFYVVSLKQKK